jgi:hypothetical protein
MIVPSQLAMDKCWVCRQPRNMRQTNRQISGGKNYRQLECQHFKENTPIKLRGRRNYVGRVHFSISRVGRLNRLPAMRRQRRTFIRDLLCQCSFRCFVISGLFSIALKSVLFRTKWFVFLYLSEVSIDKSGITIIQIKTYAPISERKWYATGQNFNDRFGWLNVFSLKCLLCFCFMLVYGYSFLCHFPWLFGFC